MKENLYSMFDLYSNPCASPSSLDRNTSMTDFSSICYDHIPSTTTFEGCSIHSRNSSTSSSFKATGSSIISTDENSAHRLFDTSSSISSLTSLATSLSSKKSKSRLGKKSSIASIQTGFSNIKHSFKSPRLWHGDSSKSPRSPTFLFTSNSSLNRINLQSHSRSHSRSRNSSVSSAFSNVPLSPSFSTLSFEQVAYTNSKADVSTQQQVNSLQRHARHSSGHLRHNTTLSATAYEVIPEVDILDFDTEPTEYLYLQSPISKTHENNQLNFNTTLPQDSNETIALENDEKELSEFQLEDNLAFDIIEKVLQSPLETFTAQNEDLTNYDSLLDLNTYFSL